MPLILHLLTERRRQTVHQTRAQKKGEPPHVFPLDQQHSVRCSYLGKGPRQWWLIFLWAFGCPFETCPNKTRRPQKTWQVVLDGHLYSMDNRRLLALLLLQGCRRHQRILARCRVLSPTDPRVAERYSQRIYRLKKDRRLGAEKWLSQIESDMEPGWGSCSKCRLVSLLIFLKHRKFGS